MKSFVPERFWCIKQIDIFRDVAEADADALAQITSFQSFKTEGQLCAEGVYLLKEGRVKIYETPHDDAEPVTLEVLEPGEMFGAVAWEADEGLPNVAAEAITEGIIGVVSVRNFMFFLKRKPHLAMPMRGQGGRFIARLLKRFPLHVERRDFPASGPRHPERVNKLSNVAFRSAASRLALLLQNYATPPLPDGTVWTCKFSTKVFSRLIGSSEEKMEVLLEKFQQHRIIKKRLRRIQILDTWQLKKIANSRMSTFSRTPQGAPTADETQAQFSLPFSGPLSESQAQPGEGTARR